jgi:solute carrier family 13 (sodium-dependent dicarboxylate transporter), member 2/3/5
MLKTRFTSRIRNFSFADSRLAARRTMKRVKWPVTRNLTMLAVIIIGCIFFVHFFVPAELDPSARHALFILVLAAALWISEAVPPFAVSFIIIGLSVFFLESLAPLDISDDWEKYVNTWSSPVIWILLGGFMLAIGAQITKFDRKFSSVVIKRFGTNPYRLLLGIMLTTGVLSMFISNTATTAMMLTIIMPFAKQYGKDEPIVKAMLLGVAAAATLGGIGTVIGSSPNAIALGILQSAGYDFTFTDWMIPGVPTAISLILIAWLILKSLYKTKLKKLQLIEVEESVPRDWADRNTTENRVIVVITFLVTVGLWMTSTLHQIPVAVVSLIPIIIFTAVGIIEAEEIKLIPWDTLILVAGGLTLGIAINDSGLAAYMVEQLPVFENPLFIILVVAIVTSLASNVMSNTAAASILIPFGAILVPPEYILLMVVTLGFAASTALLLPISTPPNALVFSTNYLKQADFRVPGLIITLISPFFILFMLWLFIHNPG